MRMRLAAFLLVMAVLLGASGDNATKVYSVQLSTWFENAWDRAILSPDGHWAIYGAPGQVQLIDLRNGIAEPDKLRGGLDRVMNAVFLPDGTLARFGARGGKLGWFVPVGQDLQFSSLPPDAMPQWSPDGKLLAFYLTQKPEDGIFLGRLDNQKRYNVGGSVTGFTFSPRGDNLYVLGWQSDGSSALIRINCESGEKETVASNLDAAPFSNSMGVSPDGSHLYVALASKGEPNNQDRHRPEANRDLDIYEIDLASGDRRIKVRTSNDDFAPIVSNAQLYWTRNVFRDSIALLPFGGGKAEEVIEGGELPRWTPDGNHLAFIYGGQGWPWRLADFALSIDVGMISIDASGRPISAKVPFITGTGEDFAPVWSPNRQWIAFHSHRSVEPVSYYASPGQSDDIYLRRASGDIKEIRLTDFGWEAGVVSWSPDGRHLVFCTWDRGNSTGYKPWEGGGTPVGFSQPWIITIDPSTGRAIGTERLKLPSNIPGADEAAWSTRTDEIAIEEKIGSELWAIWIVSPDGKKARKVVEYPSPTYGGIAWSPDGKSIIFAGLSEGKMQLFAVSASGGQPRQLTHDADNLLHPQVSPDGHWIACTRLTQAKELWRMELK